MFSNHDQMTLIDQEDGTLTVKGGLYASIIAPGSTSMEQYGQYSILANQLDFSKLTGRASLFEHLMLNIGVLSTWIFIVSYITLECSEVKRERELQLFLFSSCIAIFFNLMANPFYFKRFTKKYVPTTSQQLFEKTQPIPSSAAGAAFGSNPNKLHLSVEEDVTNNQLAYHDGDVSGNVNAVGKDGNLVHFGKHRSVSDVDHDEDGEDGACIGLCGSSQSPKEIAYFTFLWMSRIGALTSALTLSYYIYLDLSQNQYTDFTRYCIVCLAVSLFVGNLPLMGHYMLYFHRLFLTYYLVGWVTVFAAEFAYFHMVRHVEEEYFAAFILVNCIFFVFHIVATTWSCYVLKHRTLYMLDPQRFPNSHHFRFYINLDGQFGGQVHNVRSVSTEYMSSQIALSSTNQYSSNQSDLSVPTPATTASSTVEHVLFIGSHHYCIDCARNVIGTV